MSINGIERQEIVIGQANLTEKFNSHLGGISVKTSPSGELSLSLKGTTKTAAAGYQQAWFTIIDNIPDMTKFGSIDAKPTAAGADVTWTLTPPGLLRLAVYMAY